ncbi:MAG: hypothetical protein KGN16_07375, partial [Burkholderiales bacterium]|nr:hypothetical protein [Burkholderiales bacterium]
MKIECGSLEYALARLAARPRADAALWRRIEVERDFAPLLELARAGALRPWLVGITAASGVHEVESALRRHWRERVAEVAGWMPAAWRPALLWCAWLPDLAPLQHLLHGGVAPAWMEGDADWRELARAQPAQRVALLGRGAAAALAAAPQDLVGAWTAEWRRRLPAGERRAQV